MKTSFKKQISSMLKGPSSPVRRSMIVTDDELEEVTNSRTIVKSRSFLQETTLSTTPNRSDPISIRNMKKSSESFEELPSPGSTPPSLGSSFKRISDVVAAENDALDDIISLQSKLLQALSTIKVLKQEKSDLAKSAATKIEKLEKREKELKNNFIRISNEECSQLLHLIDQGQRIANATVVDQRMLQQIFIQLESQIADYQELLTNPATPSPEYSNSPSSPLLTRRNSDRERIKQMEIIGDLEEELQMSKFTNNMLRQAQVRIEDECKNLQAANSSLRQTNDQFQLEIAQLKAQLEKQPAKARPPIVFEKMLEELRENLSHEIKEKERWKRYYIESSEEMEELKEELEREERRQARLRKENAELEMELEEQAVIFEKCRELDILVRKKFAAQMDELEKTLQLLKGAQDVDVEKFAILSRMRSHDQSYGELLLKHEADYKREYQERAKKREEQFKKEEEEIKAKKSEFKSRAIFDQVQQKIRSFQ